MAAPKGHPKWGGRKKGTPNKTTAAVKEALSEAFERLGGIESLVKWGLENQTEFYKLWVRMLPTEVTNADAEPIKILIETVDEPTPPS